MILYTKYTGVRVGGFACWPHQTSRTIIYMKYTSVRDNGSSTPGSVAAPGQQGIGDGGEGAKLREAVPGRVPHPAHLMAPRPQAAAQLNITAATQRRQ